MTKGEYETLLILLNPVAPHITEELWQIIGGTGYVYQQKWPEFDEAKTVENTVEIAVQINGKTKEHWQSAEMTQKMIDCKSKRINCR